MAAKLISNLLGAPRPALSLPSLDLVQRRFEIGHQLRIGSLAGGRPSDENIIGPRRAATYEHLGGNRAQAPLGPVADYRVADLAARREADPHHAAGLSLRRP